MASGPWSLTAEQRAETVSRIRANMASMAFFRNTPMSEETLTEESRKLEAKAYAAAQVSGTVTTGHRPHEETLQGYISKLSQLVLETVARAGEGAAAPAAPSSAAPAASHSLDLTGQREFLTAETARDALAPLLSGSAPISHVKLSTKSFGAEAAEVAAEAILRVAGTLTHADLADVIAGRPEEEALAALRTMAAALAEARLVELDLSDNALGEKGLRAAAAAFAGQPALERLAFRNVGCSVHACAALDELLAEPAALRALSLYNNMSGDEGAAHVARLLARAPRLEEFSMVSSRVGPEGGAALLQALAPRAAELVALDVHDNPITEEAAPALVDLVSRAGGLRRLNLTDTGLGDAATAENELEDEGLRIVAGALGALPLLERLDVSGNQATREGIFAVVQGLAGAKNLAFLGIDENELSDRAIDLIKAGYLCGGSEALASRGQADVLGSLDNNMEVSDEEEDLDLDFQRLAIA
ncbi:hypothetical protein QBZ16_002291 [Prototheca wickerhamii]|uniref:WPP domain-containing protein n=1 Tax=Prototheca wickerhamii TaxID=3111 RepID=A0AAD9IK32_PROWI|nr:hypothetical protein QBZ16_002291 [Prototheca wickerhamii]